MSKIYLDDIRGALDAEHWTLISDKYTNLDTEMIYECPEGHRVFAPWKKMRTKFVCPTCQSNSILGGAVEIIPKPRGARRVLALDQASHKTGYAIFDNGALVKYGVFHTELDDEIARDNMVKTWLRSMIGNWRPDYIGIEGIQFQEESSGQKMGVTVFQTLARLQGILMETCFDAKVPYEVCPTNTWRHNCGVKGKTRSDKKRSMQLLVKQWYDVSVTDDEADAIGIGHYLSTSVEKTNTIENWEV